MNPLLTIPFALPFDQIEAGHVVPGIRELIVRAQAAIDAVIRGQIDPASAATLADAGGGRAGRGAPSGPRASVAALASFATARSTTPGVAKSSN